MWRFARQHTLGFDRPLIVQCGDFIWHVRRGDFGQSLHFLGLGVQPPTPTWGSMLADSRDYLTRANGARALSGGSRWCTVSPQGRRRVRACQPQRAKPSYPPAASNITAPCLRGITMKVWERR